MRFGDSQFRAKRRKRTPSTDRRGVYKALREIKDQTTRNVLRGVLSTNIARSASSKGINLVRKNAHKADLALAVELLIGRYGAFPFSNAGGTYRNLLITHTLEPIGTEEEITFLVGHLNGWKDKTLGILGALSTLRPLALADPVDALGALTIFAKEWGASNYLAKKTAYLMARASDARTPEVNQQFSKLSDVVGQRKYPSPYFTALESIDLDFPYFTGISTRVQGYRRFVTKGDFRQLLHLNNIIPSPVSLDDIGPFLRKAHAMSLVDEVVSLLQLLHIGGDDWKVVRRTIKQTMHSELFDAFTSFGDEPFDPSALYSDIEPDAADLAYYRRSIAFLEFPAPARYRHFVDKVLAPRLLPTLVKSGGDLGDYSRPSRRDLSKALVGFRNPNDYKDVQSTGIFLRTFYFLLYMNLDAEPHRLDSHELRFILEHTEALDVLLTEEEIERLYVLCDDASRPLVTVLALALYKSRAVDEDIDFKFRFSLADTVNAQFDGKLEKFFEWLLMSTPQIANFLLSTLDRSTLQKLYWIISSADEADRVRQSILRLVGRAREHIAYFIEADAIEAQRQVSKLRKYFDDSRIYIDGFSMKKWLIENPNAYTQEYARVIEHHLNTIQANAIVIDADGSIRSGVAEIDAAGAYDYVLTEVAKYAFEQFCLNTNFGIESYLGRRIRHNTLTGMMMGGVDSIIDSGRYQVLTFDDDFTEAHDKWLDSYRMLLRSMRLDILQFKSNSKPRGIFSSELKALDEATKLNIVKLRNGALAGKSNEVFLDMLIRFCWQEIDPQLAIASKTITVDILKQAQAGIDEHLGGFNDELAGRYRTELWNAVHERFTRLGSWFRQPESGFVSASTRQLGELIMMEATNHALLQDAALEWVGESADVSLDGLSVHRMYDCLSVLIRNALTYRSDGSPVSIVVNSVIPEQASIGRLSVSVISLLPETAERGVHIARLESSFAATDLDTSMAREGYSGIKKLRFITQNSEGRPTADYQIDGDECKISFALTVELAERESLR